MKKKIYIPIIAVSVLLLIVFTIVTIFSNRDLSFSKGIYFKTDTSHMMICKSTPIVISDKSKNGKLFEKLSDGDKILILHDGIRETYPSATGAYLCIKTADGEPEDIPETVIDSLSEPEWSENRDSTSILLPNTEEKKGSVNVPYTAHDYEEGYSRQNHDILDFQIYLVKNEKELYEYYSGYENEYTIIEPATVYDESFFKDNYLIIVYKFAHSGSVTRKVSDITFDGEGGVNIIIEDYCPVVYTDDCSGWSHFIELSREYDPESIKDINVELRVLESFSYIDDMFFLGDNKKGLKTDGFVNTQENPITCEKDAISLAKNEVTVTYSDTFVAYDFYEDMWRITFHCENPNTDGGQCQYVYIYSNGITKSTLIKAFE